MKTQFLRLLLALILLIAAGLRFFALDGSSLWSDEGNTWALVQRSFAAIARDAAADIHPPGYYWLLKLWTMVWGTEAYALRAFSAVCGVLLVGLTYAIARQIAAPQYTDQYTKRENILSAQVIGLLAAAIAAFNPLQIYYSQEARMYMPLALAGAGLYAALIIYARREAMQQSLWGPALGFVLCAVLGLWLHYSFPILLLGASLYYFIHWYLQHGFLQHGFLWHEQNRASQSPKTPSRNWRALVRFALLCLAAAATFLPWLPTALRQILNWPQGDVPVSIPEGVRLTLDTLLFGPINFRPSPVEPWLWGAAILPLLGLWALARIETAPRPHTNTDVSTHPHTGTPQPTIQPLSQPPVAMPALALWLLLPVAMMFALGLFSDAFLKFLLAASPPWAIATAWSIYALPALVRGGGDLLYPRAFWRKATLWSMGALIVTAVSGLAVWTLPRYYTDPTARDNYADIARYVAAHTDISATGDSSRQTLVVLNAPGQRDVWAYYDPGVPVLALPETRPPDRAATEAALAEAIQNEDIQNETIQNEGGVERIFGIFWATDESDPEGIVEQWLETHTFPGLASWQGNVRLVDYSVPANLVCAPFAEPVEFSAPGASGSPAIVAVERCLESDLRQSLNEQEEGLTVAAGDVLLLGLGWHYRAAHTAENATGNIAVSLQVLDSRNQVVAQRDAPLPPPEPQDASEHASQHTLDNHGIPIPIGTPPGKYRLILALYNPHSGERYITPADSKADSETGSEVGSDARLLDTVHITRPVDQRAALIDAMHTAYRQLGPVILLGYDLHRRDFSHAPETPVHPGDPVQITFYWQAPPTLPADWPADLHFELRLGQAQLYAPLAGGDYPTSQWQPNEIVRARFEVPFDGEARRPHLRVEADAIRLHALP